MSIAFPPELVMMMMLWLPMQPAGQPAPAATVFRYVPAQANATVTLDAASLTTAALRGFHELGKQPFIKRSPELAQKYEQLDQGMARGLKMLQLFGGVDPVKDVRWATLSLAVRGRRKPDFMVAAAGKLSLALAERIATTSRSGAAEPLPNGQLFVATRPGAPSVAWTKDDVLLIGSEAMLRPLLLRRPRPTALSRLASAQHDAQSYCTLAFRPEGKAQKQLVARLPGLARSLGQGFEGVVLSLRYDGLRLGLAATNGRVLARYRTLLDGAGDYLIATEHIARGSIKLGDALIAPQDAQLLPGALRAFAGHKGELLRYLRKYLPLSRTPSHRTVVDGRRRLAVLTYKGSRYAGIVPLFAAIGLVAGRRSRRSPMPPSALPPQQP